MQRRLRVLFIATIFGCGSFMLFSQWHANAAAKQPPLPLDLFERGPYTHKPNYNWRVSDRRSPGPSIDPYVRPEFARQMRELQPTILAAAARHNHPKISKLSDHEFAVIVALIMYNEHFGWFEERVKPVQLLTPWYEDLQRETNEAGISDLSLWPANIRPSVALEILRGQVPLPHGTGTLTVPLTIYGSSVRPDAFASRPALYAAISVEIANPALAVEYLAANLERGVYRARAEGVTVTWRALAAWHNQGIVAPEDLRANATASDYVHRASAYFAKARALIDMPPPMPTWRYIPDLRPDSRSAADSG